jgi:endonuclease/exonuclease/phosphatase (EEP) superfamily protein YafD
MKRLLRTLFYLSFWILSVMLVAGFLCFLHPAFDAFSHFRIHLLVLWLGFVLVSLFLQRGVVRYLLTLLFLVAGGYTGMLLQPYLGTSEKIKEARSIRLMQFNLSFRNKQLPRLNTYMEQEQIEVATFQEVTSKHRAFLEGMRKAYPFQRYCKFAGVGDVAILSKYPFAASQESCMKSAGLVWSQIMVEGEPLSIVSIHLHWPFPYKQSKQVDWLQKTLQSIPAPKIIAGDFNAASWSHTLHRIVDYSQTSIIPGLRWTLNFRDVPPLPRLQLPIDHILISDGLSVKYIDTGVSLGSDHLPVVAEIIYKKER